MCGIFGALGPSNYLATKHRNNIHKALHHRGPDDYDFQCGDKFSLGFSRLAILDLSPLGSQPMTDQSGRYIIVFNGEIFNYLELKSKYLSQTKLRGSSDTEVLLQLLIKFQEEAIPLLNGMFAFCFLDSVTGDFIIATDRFGIKPLYYRISNNTLFFASELKALLEINELSWTIDSQAMLSYIGCGYVNKPNTIYNESKQLLPASYLTGNCNEIQGVSKSNKYWELNINPTFQGKFDDALIELESLLFDATKLRLRSDVPLGVFLSGGIDSGLVAALAAKMQAINCFTITYPNSQYDESKLAKKTADHIDANWSPIRLDEFKIEQFYQISDIYDEPFSDSSALPSIQICKAGTNRATVFLTGDAGDEAFAGYNRYINRLKFSKLHSISKVIPNGSLASNFVSLKNAVKIHKLYSPSKMIDSFYDEIPGNPLQLKILNKRFHKSLIEYFHERSAQIPMNVNPTINQQNFDYSYYLPNDILVKMDRASMSSSIEVRSPFLDYRIHEFAASMPRDWLINAQKGKIILRELAKQYLPTEVINAKKKGFSIPLNQWTCQNKFISSLRNQISHSDIFSDYFNLSGVNEIIELHFRKKISAGTILWRVAILLDWEKKYRYQLHRS